ncbi:hypothetical protein [Chondromyces apiculatus]|uniref:Uncharacterized protein n=1 Tax=Chondromyces apiculatus DSM 436 TaxID=1192034 RepID=A0A017T9Z3_9BACT|nr:hypothetical protein [Chondromyces apiculatus]EYF05640.1 Hypothetical protein CAP_2930 [Chondromyces apiculatus DSM 436]
MNSTARGDKFEAKIFAFLQHEVATRQFFILQFAAKVAQVSGANVKEIMGSTTAFSKSTFEYCKSRGIGLLRYYDRSTLKWELSRSPSSITYSPAAWVDVRTALLSELHQSRYFDFYGYTENVYTNSLYVFFRALTQKSTDTPGMFRSRR